MLEIRDVLIKIPKITRDKFFLISWTSIENVACRYLARRGYKNFFSLSLSLGIRSREWNLQLKVGVNNNFQYYTLYTFSFLFAKRISPFSILLIHCSEEKKLIFVVNIDITLDMFNYLRLSLFSELPVTFDECAHFPHKTARESERRL